MGVSTNYPAWFGGGTHASTAVLAPQQVAAVAPLVRVTAAYVVMYYAFCFFQSWSKLYLLWSLEPTTDRLRSPQPTAEPMVEPTSTPSPRPMPSTKRSRRTLPPNADGKKPTLVQLKYGGYGSSKTRTLRLLGDRTFLNTLEQAPPFLVSLWACGLLADVELAAFCGKLYIFFRCLYPVVFRKGMPWLLLSTVPCYNLIWYMLFRAVVACA